MKDSGVAARKILVVDDEEDICRLVSTSLEVDGYSCQTALSTHGAEILLEEDKFDAVISDVRIGREKQGGLKVLLRSKSLGIPCLLITGHADLLLAKKALNQGAARLIEKPFSMAEVKRHLSEALRDNTASNN